VADAVRSVRLPAGPVALEGVDVTALFDAERRRAACDPGTLEAALSARLAKRLAGRGVDVALLVDAYENMIAEKGLLWGLRRDLPTTFAAGFQHGALYPLLLCNFVAPGEVPFAPLPDRVVCNGPGFVDIVVREGLPADRVVAGPALRYRHLRDVPEAHGDVVLVPLPMADEIAGELLDKVLGGLAGLPVALKPHPMARADGQLAAAGAATLPPGFELLDGPMAPALARARVVVASASTTLLEAVAAGVPVVVVGRDAALDLNPLAWYPGLARVVRTAEDLRAEVQRLLDLPAGELDAWRERAHAILDESFGPVTEEALRVFLPPG
jgi:surface carbohydrate biosynthesis protein (TIGR04326 family)